MNIRPMTDVGKRAAAKSFVETWTGRGDEKQDAQNFWRDLLHDVFGVVQPSAEVEFEYPVKKEAGKNNIFIDAYIKDTAVLIEQKGKDIDLRKHYEQSDGSRLTPYGQARRYAGLLPHSMNPRWIVVSNFQEIDIHDMNNPNGEPFIVMLADLEKEYHRLNFLVDTGSENIRREMEISKKAGDLVGLLYDALLKKYGPKPTQADLHSLNVLCVRLVFCLYAEDAGIFGQHLLFHDYLKQFSPQKARKALEELFDILDTKEEGRPRFLSDDDPILASFPYVNGGLFSKKVKIDIPPITEDIYNLILRDASAGFDWSEISPTIFGAMFESTLNPETRRKGGMHYTSIENIHKVIDPLFLDELRSELDTIIAEPVARTKKRKLEAFHDKLASLEFLDPAAGSGNFLTESYLSLRRLENRVILEQTGGQIMMGAAINPIKISITQFHGIEINDFAVTVARTALWIAESQMMKETEDIVHMQLDFLPLKTQANIVEGNALRLDWESVVDKSRLSYIMGNPPFVGARETKEGSDQKKDMLFVFGADWKNLGNIDYVGGWYKKATDFMKGTTIRTALVSTNSVSQGDAVGTLWKPLFDDGVHIDFAHRTFQWDSEASIKAHVHCVIIGFSMAPNPSPKVIYSSDAPHVATNINAYLIDGDNIFVESRKKSLCNTIPVVFGSMPNDKGHLSDYDDKKYSEIVSQYPAAAPMFRPFLGATEFLHGKKRWCLWLSDVNPADIKKVKPVYDAVNGVKEFRENSDRAATRKLATTPYLFGEIRQPSTEYIIIPRHSTQNRHYIPMGFVEPDIICGDSNMLIPGASLYEFGVLQSGAHMGWTRLVCGRIKSDFRYSANIVYNNFPWPTPTEEQKKRIEATAQAILDARAKYLDRSLDTLYNETFMPPELRKAHQANDMAVLAAYGIKKGDPAYGYESACVAFLMKRYQELTEK